MGGAAGIVGSFAAGRLGLFGTSLLSRMGGALKGGLEGAAYGFTEGYVRGSVSGGWEDGWTEGVAGMTTGGLMGAALGGLLSKICFVAGTQVVVSASSQDCPEQVAVAGGGPGCATLAPAPHL